MAVTKHVTLYTRAGCHLCEVVEAQLHALQTETSFAIERVDIDSDPALQERYGWEIPVVTLDGKKVAKFRLNVEMLRRRLLAP